MSAIGFESLSEDGLVRVLRKYDDGLARIERGETRYACGGTERQLRRWRRALVAEMQHRHGSAA